MKEMLTDFGLPEILKENLEESEYNHRIKYRNLYIRLIKRCQGMTEQELSGYNEKHHVLPKCMGGSNEKENLVLMPVRYHVMAHLILVEIYPNISGLRLALILITNIGDKNNQINRSSAIKRISTRLLSKIREESCEKYYHSKEHIESISGKNNPFFGKHHSEETKKKLSTSHLGRKLDPEIIKKRAEKQKGLKRTKETREKISKARTGMKFSEKHRKNISLSRLGIKYKSKKSKETWDGFKEKVSGENHWNSKKVINLENKVFNSITEAAKYAGVTKTTMSRWIKNPNNLNWNYHQSD